MYVIMMQTVYTYYAVYIRRKMFFFKFIEPSVWPQQPGLELCSRKCITVRFPAWTISMTEWLRMRTCWENLDQDIIDKAIDHWRVKLKAVVRLNDGHTEQLF